MNSSKVANDAPNKGLPHAGAERLKADYRMYSGLLLTLGLCAAYGSFADIVSLTGNPTVDAGLPLATLLAGIVQAFLGFACMGVGFMGVVMDKKSTLYTTIATASIQLAWLPFLVGLTSIGMGAVSDPSVNPFIPFDAYNPSAAAVKFLGAMSFFGLVSYAIGFIGSLGYMGFSMHAIAAGAPGDRSGLYHRGRAKLYNGLLMLAGFTQLAIGSFIINTYGNGPLPAPIFAVVYPVIFFPEISVTVGLLQMVVGAIGIARSLRAPKEDDSTWFQYLCFFMYICMMSMQILSQIAYAPDGTGAAAAPTLGCIYFGLAFMPGFLDWKSNHVPNSLEGYYDEAVADISDEGTKDALEVEVPESAENNV